MSSQQNRVQKSMSLLLNEASERLSENLASAKKAHNVGLRLGISPNEIQGLTTALASNAIAEPILRSLAIEVGLKYIIQASGTRPKHTHQLDLLFDQVSSAHQAEIINGIGLSNATELKDKLKGNCPFIAWRYCYESKDDIHYDAVFFKKLSHSIIEICNKIE